MKRLIIGLIAAVMGALPSHAALVASYALDGTGVDSSGYGLNLALSGTSAATDRFGQAGGALAFDGTTSFGDYRGGNLGAVSLGASSWTVNAWVNTTGADHQQAVAGRYRCGWDCGQGTVDSAVWEISLADNKPQFWVRTDQNHDFIAASATALSTDTWHMVTGVLDQDANTVSLFVDGVLSASLSYSAGDTVTESGAPLEIGNRFVQTYIPPNAHFSGALDDINIFSGALTLGEITTLEAAALPEPAGLALLGTGLAGLLARLRRKVPAVR